MTDMVVSMPHAAIAEDGSLIQMEFQLSNGTSTVLSFDPSRFDGFVSRANELLAGVRNRKLSVGDHLEIHPVQAVATSADAAIGGGKVLLSIRAGNGVLHHFAISPEEAEKLRPELFRTAKSARKQTLQPCH